MRTIRWLVLAALGFGAMAWSYFAWQRLDEQAPWASGILVVAGPEAEIEAEAGEFQGTPVRIRLLEMGEFQRGVAVGLGRQDAAATRALEAKLSEKLILLGPQQAGIGEGFLASGRMPVAGRAEVLAGCQVSHKDRLAVAGRELQVVGVLARDVALLADSYLLPPDASVAGLFDPADASVRAARLVRLAPTEARSRQLRKRLGAVYPRQQYARVGATVRVQRGPYYLYLAGQALLVLGGSGFLIGLYTALGSRPGRGWLRDPLAQLAARRRLLWAVHLVYFGLMVLGSLIVYELPALQAGLLGAVGSQIASEQGVLGIAGKAYGSGSIPLAAVVTFAINFSLGSVVHITLPSLVIPGSGVLMAAFRAALWGLILAPTVSTLSPGTLAHSWTLLLEGEAYILAAFFALLIPAYMCQQSLGGRVLERYGRAVLLNMKACLLIAIVLIAAACYEATEVIMMMKG